MVQNFSAAWLKSLKTLVTSLSTIGFLNRRFLSRRKILKIADLGCKGGKIDRTLVENSATVRLKT